MSTDLDWIEHAPLAHHGVVVEVLLQALPQLHRPLIERNVAGKEIVGADDGGVAPDIAASEPTLLQHGNVGDAVFLGEVERRRQPVPTAADDDDVIGGL